MSKMQCCGSGMFFPDQNFFHPGSRVKQIPGSRIRIILRIKKFNPKIVSKLEEIWSGMFIPDPRFGFWVFTNPGFRIQRSKRQRIPDPEPQHCQDENNFLLYPYSHLALQAVHYEATSDSCMCWPAISSSYSCILSLKEFLILSFF
jgi:hypothetical protein